MIELKKIEKVYNQGTTTEVRALKGISLSIKRGEIFGVIGLSGAGKSTLVKVLTGVYHKTNGTVVFDGQQIEPESPLRSQQIGISTVYQEVNLCANLSVAENIYSKALEDIYKNGKASEYLKE